jgi:hypothetical protein
VKSGLKWFDRIFRSYCQSSIDLFDKAQKSPTFSSINKLAVPPFRNWKFKEFKEIRDIDMAYSYNHSNYVGIQEIEENQVI